MDLMTTFASPAGHPMRVVDRAGEPWFVAADLCNALDLANTSQSVKGLGEDEQGISSVYTPSGNQDMLTVSESGMYVLIFKSRKPEAKTFRRWVTQEVLPAIRKTGRYEAPNQDSWRENHQIFMEGFRQGKENALSTLERFRVLPIKVGRPRHTDVSRPAPTENVGDDGTFLLPGMVEAVKGAILKFAGEQTTMTAIFEHVRIPRNRANEMGVAYLLKSNGYERFHQMSKGIRTWVYRMAEHT